jgi:hypothetical protein
MGQNLYPTSTTGALDILSRHKPDNANKRRNNQPRNGNPKRDEDQDQEGAEATSFAQKEIICYICGKSGHKAPQCPMKGKIKPENYFINMSHKAFQAYCQETAQQEESAADDESVQSARSTRSTNSSRNTTRRSEAQATPKTAAEWFQAIQLNF